MVVGESRTEEDVYSVPFSSDRDKLVRTILSDVVGADMSKVHFTYLVKTPTTATARATEADAMRDYDELREEIQRIQPECILMLGELALNFIGQVKGVLKYHGEVMELDYCDGMIPPIRTVFTFAPAYLKYNEARLKDYAVDIDRAWRITTGWVEPLAKVTRIERVTKVEQVRELVGYIRQTKEFAFDYETTGLEIFTGDVTTCLSVCYQPGISYAIPLHHAESPFSPDEIAEIYEILNEVFDDPEIRKIGHNTKFDLHLLRNDGIARVRGRIDDTMLMHSLWDETARHSLEHLTDEFFPDYAGYKLESTKYSWKNMPMDVLVARNGTDADMTFRLCVLLESKLLEDERVYKIYRNLTIPALKVLQKLEYEGVGINKPLLLEYLTEVNDMLERKLVQMRGYDEVLSYVAWKRQSLVDAKVEEIRIKLLTAKPHMAAKYNAQLADLKAGNVDLYEEVNFDSTKQLSDLLYSRHGFGYTAISGGGTGKEVLDELEDHTGFLSALLAYRSLMKLKGTYLEGILKRMDSADRLHPTYKVNGTVTGRLSCTDPNLQNIPNVAKLNDADVVRAVAMIKRLFIPDPGQTLLQADYSQAELRIIADFAEETNMLAVYAAGGDIHANTAAHLLGITLEKFKAMVDKEKKKARTRAKAGNFGLIYGMMPPGYQAYAKQNYGIEISLKTAERDRAAFFKLYPELLNYHKLYIAKGQKFGYVRTLFGRKRHLPDIYSPNRRFRSDAEREAINSPVQGTAGEFTIFAIVLLDFRLPETVRLRNTVHDSIIYSTPDEQVDKTARMVAYTGANLPTMKYFGKELEHIGMKMDIEISKESWKDMAEYSLIS